MPHISVLKNIQIDNLNIKKDGIYVDCTLGSGGHTKEIANKLGAQGHIYCFDCDVNACNIAKKKLADISDKITIFNENYVNLKKILNLKNIYSVDGIIFDLGMSSMQVDDKFRGFSYRFDSFLDMRMDTKKSLTASKILNTYCFKQLYSIFKNFGQEEYSYKIAKGIIYGRKEQSIETVNQLLDIIKRNKPNFYKCKRHPARKIFQALRIEVNKELENLQLALVDAFEILNPGARLSVITFHSLEDKIVKQFFLKQLNKQIANNYMEKIRIETSRPRATLITKKPIIPSKEEIDNNSRSRSAKLRILEKIY